MKIPGSLQEGKARVSELLNKMIDTEAQLKTLIGHSSLIKIVTSVSIVIALLTDFLPFEFIIAIVVVESVFDSHIWSRRVRLLKEQHSYCEEVKFISGYATGVMDASEAQIATMKERMRALQ